MVQGGAFITAAVVVTYRRTQVMTTGRYKGGQTTATRRVTAMATATATAALGAISISIINSSNSGNSSSSKDNCISKRSSQQQQQQPGQPPRLMSLRQQGLGCHLWEALTVVTEGHTLLLRT